MGFHFEKANCPKCGSASNRVVITGKDYLYHLEGAFYISECAGCGFWFQTPRPVAGEIVALYPEDYLPYNTAYRADDYLISRRYMKHLSSALGYSAMPPDVPLRFRLMSLFTVFGRYNRWQSEVDLIPRFVPGGRLLDIGCANGNKLFALEKMGWKELYGIELFPAAAKAAKSAGFKVECGFTEEVLAGYPDGFFDVILAGMLIEHLTDPFKTARLVAAKLKPGGQFLFSTHIMDTLEFRFYNEFCSCFDLPTHMVFFRRKDLQDMLKDGFTDVSMVHQSAPMDFCRSSQWRREHGKPKLLDYPLSGLQGSRLLEVASLLAAWSGLTNRVSVRCRKA